jgi:hypothetical protein
MDFIWTNHSDKKRVERISRKTMLKPTQLGGFAIIDFESLNFALKTKQVLRNTKGSHPIVHIQNFSGTTPFCPAYNTDEDITIYVKNMFSTIALTQIMNKHQTQWLYGLDLVTLYDFFGVEGMSSHYVKALARSGIRKISEVLESNRPEDLNNNKAELALAWYKRHLPTPQSIEDEPDTESFEFGIYTTVTSVAFSDKPSSKIIRHAYTAFVKGIVQPIAIIEKYKNLGEICVAKQLTALQKISKIRSVRLKNHMLRILNGDVYAKERMTRFGLINDNTCDRCGEIETRDHLIFDCHAVINLWRYFSKIYKYTHGHEYELSPINMLNCGDNYNSLATTTIIAELIKMNVLNRLVCPNIDHLRDVIKQIVAREIKSSKYYRFKIEKSWKKWEKLLQDSHLEDDGSVVAARHVVDEGLHQLASTIGVVEHHSDAQT